MGATMRRAAGILAIVMAAVAAPVHGAEDGKTKILFDFENDKAQPFDGGKITSENPIDGKFSLLADNGVLKADVKQDWTGYDLFKVDVFNPSDKPVKLLLELRDAETRDYWTRVNFTTVVQPGKSTVSLPTDMYVGEKSRPGRVLEKSKVRVIALAPGSYPLMFDNMRLEKLDKGPVVEGLRAFDFGTEKSPVMIGYTGVSPETAYTKERGFGFLKGPKHYATGFDGMQPDALFEDFIATGDADFQVDLPNGKYHVLMNIDSPGGYWGEVQQYSNRRVSVNGHTVVDEKMTLDDFQKHYFRNAHHEDLPGVDTFKQYVEPMFSVKQFDIDVTDGKAVFEMRGEGRFPISLSAMVIYPAGKAAEGEKFWAWTTSERRREFDEYFKQIVPTASGAKAPAEGYTLFSRNFMTPPNAFDGPREHEAIAKEGLAITAARGEEAALSFSVQPAGDIGAIDVSISELAFAGEQEQKAAPLPASAVQTGWLDYRISRVAMDGTTYEVQPRYWHPTPAPSAGKMTRTFWLRVKPPAGAMAGPYRATITVKPANQAAKTIPLTINVLPFDFDPIKDVAAGPWGASISLPWDGSDPKTQQWQQEMLDKSLTAIREAGCTTMTGLPHIGIKASGGKVTLDFSRADREMKMLRDHGFDMMIDSYGQGLAYPMYGSKTGPDEAWAKNAGFADMKSFLKDLYGQIEAHGKANNWLPVAWNLCDEPLGEAAKAAAKNCALHEEVAKELGLKLNVFSGATSMEGNDPGNVHYALVRALGMPSLNLHDEASIKVIHDDGHTFSFYNGGNRWTFGRYMKALVVKYGLAYRTTWHFNVVAGDPYYALDCREDDYCWYNTDDHQTMVPSLSILAQIQPGLNDYRYLTTLQRLLKEKASSPNAAAAKKVFDEQMDLVAGKDRTRAADFAADREAVTKAILSLIGPK